MIAITVESLARIKTARKTAATVRKRLELLRSGKRPFYTILSALRELAEAIEQLPPPLLEEAQAERRALHAHLLAREFHAAYSQWKRFTIRLTSQLLEWERDLSPDTVSLTQDLLDLAQSLHQLLGTDAEAEVVEESFESLCEQVDQLPEPRRKEGRLLCSAVGEQIRRNQYHGAAYQLGLYLRRLRRALSRE
jgi:hypothetical protein